MKLKLLHIATAFLLAHFATAQVLYSEDFDNLTVGDLSTDPSGNTPGQGGWNTSIYFLGSISDVRIVTEPGRGKVLLLEHPGSFSNGYDVKKDLDIDWNQRVSTNNVIKVEYDFFTGNETVNPSSDPYTEETSLFMIKFTNGANGLLYNTYRPYSNVFRFRDLNGPQLTKNNWYRMVCYIDYPNNKIHFVIPSIGHYEEHVFIPNNTLPVTIDNYTPDFILLRVGGAIAAGTNSRSFISKYDDITISAVNQVPLKIEEIFSYKFNLFPNPVNDVVTITNSENIGIEEIVVYDMDGKRVKEQKCKNENEISLNLSNLSSGTYLLHIKTKEGIAVKKVVKK